MTYNCLSYLPGCGPEQEITIQNAITDISKLMIFTTDNGQLCYYDNNALLWSYSIDDVCWSCYMTYEDISKILVDLKSDFFIHIKVQGSIYDVKYEDASVVYTTQIAQCFDFTYMNTTSSSNLYNPYANMTNAIALQQSLNDSVAAIAGVPIYYIKLEADANSKDITFKEYALMNVKAIKQLKLIIADGQMPSSKPEFMDFGLEWSSDWECEITKSSFAIAFGNTTQPTSGDLIYIPMMKRMWMVNEAYEEKNSGLMWVATTFKLALVKYQEKASVDLGDTESFVNSLVKNTYDELFGEDEHQTLDSGYDTVQTTNYPQNNLYAVYESDATRKYVTCDCLKIDTSTSLYYKGTLLSDSRYLFNPYNDIGTGYNDARIIYQNKYCSSDATLSFIITIRDSYKDSKVHKLITIGNIRIDAFDNIIDNNKKLKHKFVNISLHGKDNYISLDLNVTYFVVIRWSHKMNISESFAFKYKYPENIPMYKLGPQHYYFDIDNPSSSFIHSYNTELNVSSQQEVTLHGINGSITNIKLYDVYIDNYSEIMQMYPTNQHLLINDTARKLLDPIGVTL